MSRRSIPFYNGLCLRRGEVVAPHEPLDPDDQHIRALSRNDGHDGCPLETPFIKKMRALGIAVHDILGELAIAELHIQDELGAYGGRRQDPIPGEKHCFEFNESRSIFGGPPLPTIQKLLIASRSSSKMLIVRGLTP